MDSPWQYSTVHNSACKVIEEQTLWGQTVCRVWLPNQDAVVRVPRSALRPLSADLQPEIEAGLVMREFKLRGLVRRTLVVSPKGNATQWVAEMQTHFNEQFQLVLGDDISTVQHLAPQFGKRSDHRSSAWSILDQVIVSLDLVTFLDKRRGWTESPDDEIAELYDMDGQELLDELLNELLKSHVLALRSEGCYVETVLDATVRCEQAGPDAKAEVLIEWIYKLQAEENEPDLKVLIFTEFVPTQQMPKGFTEARGISVVTLNGSTDMEEREQAQDAFCKSHRVLVSTDAGGEGLNLQFAHVIINYDIPWNPMRLEQRIGRVDRIGQPKTVRAINFVFEDSVVFRVREVLEQKLITIFDEFGIDKTGDVLDSARIRCPTGWNG